MDIIQFKEVVCRSCYKCIRHCAVKSISFHDDQARIVDSECILCGRCTQICPQSAKQVASELPAVQALLAGDAPVIASVAPSFVAAFGGTDLKKLSFALKRLGFAAVEEVAIGATEVSRQYMRLIEERKMPNIISTCCPSLVLLVQKHFPQLLPMLAPVVSPAVAHARKLKAQRPEAKVVFVGPCISKKHEARLSEDIDAVLLFDEVKTMLEENGVSLRDEDTATPGMEHTVSRLYPIPGGILDTMPAAKRTGYDCIAIDGVERCIETLKTLRDDGVTGYFLEMSICEGCCVSGPGMHTLPYIVARNRVSDFAGEVNPQPLATELTEIDAFSVHSNLSTHTAVPDEVTIAEILAKIGKTTEGSMLNCGACGYDTCREKAIAVYQGKANLMMCLPYLREHAESLSNVIIEATPNGLVMLDDEGLILQYNRASQKMFAIDENMAVGYPASLYIDLSCWEEVKAGRAVYDQETRSVDGHRSVVQSILPAAHNTYLIVSRDVTEREAERLRQKQMREETLEVTQRVINNQMRAAQEIASLLGETTGESKAALSKLKALLKQGGRQ